MNLSPKKETGRGDTHLSVYCSTFPAQSMLETEEQIKRFELLRLAFFVLKLRKLDARVSEFPKEERREGAVSEQEQEWAFRCNLLRHAIFQQVLTLSKLGAREQAMQIIETCRK